MQDPATDAAKTSAQKLKSLNFHEIPTIKWNVFSHIPLPCKTEVMHLSFLKFKITNIKLMSGFCHDKNSIYGV